MTIKDFDPANSIIFLGSGFTAGATNIAMQKVPAGHPLLMRLAEELQEDPIDLDLKSAADEFLSRTDISLYDLLYETFTINNLLPYQDKILSLPWGRIYTTNYDDAISVAKGPKFPIYTFEEPRPRKLPPAFGVHLHGSIRKANERNANSQLILNNRSYDIIARDYPDWFVEFQRDRRTFDACYFVGFSLSDHHIAGLMTSGEEPRKHTYFISRPNPKNSFVRRASDYGEIVPIGFDAFSELSKSLPAPENPKNISDLKSFKYLRPGLDSRTLAPPTPVEIINLVTFGTFNQTRYFNTPDGYDYVSKRSGYVDSVLEILNKNKTALIHSRLGNGKTIFISIFASRAASAGYKCLLWRHAGRRLKQDLEFIASEARIIIIFDDYDAAIEHIEHVSSVVPEAKFVVTARTSQQEVRLHEIVDILPRPVKRVSINTFSKIDKDELVSILDRAGARVERLEETIRAAHEIRDIVIKLYNHSEIADKINLAVGKLSNEVISIVILSCLIKWAGVDIEDDYIQQISGYDVYAEIRKSEILTKDFIDIRDENIEMRSSLLSEYLIQKVFPIRNVLDACFNLTISSTRRKNDRPHRRLSGEMMKFSTLQRIIKFRPETDGLLERHYIRLSNDKDVNEEPLFWLQYAILMKNRGNIKNAVLFLNTGYDRAKKIEGFKTFQLDTQALSIYILEEIDRGGNVIEGFEKIVSSIKTVSNMINEDSNRQYAIEVIGEVPSFVERRISFMKEFEKIILILELNRIISILASFSVEEKAYTGSELIRVRIEEAALLLARPIA